MFKKAGLLLKDEQGSLDQLVWVIGGALVVAMIAWGASTYAPSAVQSFFTTAVGWVQSKFQAIIE